MVKYYNLTEPQKNIYLREEYYNGTSINNISFTYCINKDLDIDICKKVINKIIENNEGLRIQITKRNNDIVQYIKKYEYEDIEVESYFNKEMIEIKNIMQHDAEIPFEFFDSKLYKIKICLLPRNRTGIYIKLHHIIADAWVTKILLKQFNELYNSFANKKEYISNTYTYIDFICKEENYFKSENYKRDKEYWENYLTDVPEAIQFKDVAIKNESESIRFTKYFSIELSEKINEYCKEKNITPYSFFMSVYAIYLYKTLGKNEFTIGTPLLNRKDYAEKQTVGMFVSTIPFIFRIDDNSNIEELIRKITVDIRNALKHQRYSYNAMLEYVRKNKEESGNLFNTILSFQNMKPDKEFIDYKYDHFWNFAGNQQSSFEIHISDYNDTGKYLLNLDFKKDLVSKKEMGLIYERLECIIKNIINNENISIKDIEYIQLIEQLDLKFKYNKERGINYNANLIELFEKQVKNNPNKVALKFKDKSVTYNNLLNKVNVIASNLSKKGIKENMPVTLLLDRSIEMIASILAVLKLGAYYIPVDPNWPLERLKYITEDAKSNYIITNNSNYITDDIKTTWIDINKIDKEIDIKLNTISNDLNRLAYVIYTSGSTGKPKGTLITNKNVIGLLESTNSLFMQTNNDIWTLFHTYTFDFSSWEIYGCLLYGGTLVIVPKEVTTNPKEFLKLIIQEKVTILNQTPAYFYKVIEEEKRLVDENSKFNLRLIILGGEAVHAEPLKYWKNKYKEITIYNGYGPTETTIFAIMGEITHKDILENNIFIGYPLINYNIKIMDKNMKMLPFGCIGEICISGTGVCNGYLNNEKLTNEKFIINEDNGTVTYKSGDVGYIGLDGRIKYIGRNDNQVKIRGFRIEIEEIEKELLKCDGVSKAVVFPIEDENYTKKIVGFIETKKENYTEEVIKQIRKNLTAYMIPKLYQVNEFPLNDNGKVDRRKLLETIKDIKKEIVKPNTDTEKELLKLISQVPKIEKISIKDDFFTDLGLDSLDIMKISTMIDNNNISIQDINDNSSIETLAKAIEDKTTNNANENIYQDVSVINKKVSFDLSNVLLTGTTGFLGIHLLRELIKNKCTKNIYCLIREKNNVSPEYRMKNAIDYYFTEEDKKYISKIKVVEGNFELERLGIKDENIIKNISTVIHCGANVSHYGAKDKFYKTNVEGTKYIIDFCINNNIKLAHISTLSVGGFSPINENRLLNENEININQDFKNHIYMITKYQAECAVLKAINNGLEAKIFRLGNIMPRIEDGLFQKNKMDNGFLCRLKTIIDTKSIPKYYKNIEIDISPVDLCSQAILTLLKNNECQTIYHINNNNFVKVDEIIKDFEIKEVTTEEQIKMIREANNPYYAHLLNDLSNEEYIETKASCNITLKELNKYGFQWNKIDDSYLKMIYKVIKGE